MWCIFSTSALEGDGEFTSQCLFFMEDLAELRRKRGANEEQEMCTEIWYDGELVILEERCAVLRRALAVHVLRM